MEIVGLRHPAGGGRHTVAKPVKNLDRDAADAAARAGNENFAKIGGNLQALKRHYRQHGRQPRRAQRHRALMTQSVWFANQPIAVHARPFRKTAPVKLADAPPREDDLVACPKFRMRARFDDSRQIDARDHRELSHHGPLPRDRQTILIVECRIGDAYSHIALRQIYVFQLRQLGRITSAKLVDQDCLKLHRFSPGP